MNHMPRDTTRIFIHVHPNIECYPNYSLFVDEFKAYKNDAFEYARENGCLAAEFLPALSEEDQKTYLQISGFLEETAFFTKAPPQMIRFTMSIYTSPMTTSAYGTMKMVFMLISGGVVAMRH